MALALVKLKKYRNGRVYEFLDYISLEVAQLGVFIQGSEHNEDEYSKAEIIKIFGEKK